MPPSRVELRRACTGDDLVGHRAQCCPTETIRSGEVIFYRAHAVYPLRVHLLCLQRAEERAEPGMVDYPTVRSARLAMQGRLPSHRSGVRLRDLASS